MERDEQRLNRRKDPSCVDDVGLPEAKPLPVRATPDCDVPPEPLEDDQFATPVPCPDPALPLALVPDPLEISNDARTASCPLLPTKPGPYGDPVTIAAETFSEAFNFQTIPDINVNQLSFLAGLSGAERATLADPDTTVSTIETITLLKKAQATFISVQVNALKDTLNATAQSAAESQLVCFFRNALQSVTCEDAGFAVGAFVTGSAPAGQEENVLNPSIVAADTFTSFDSQAAADGVARDVAISNLQCLYGNNLVSLSCLDLGFTEAVPNDTSAISFDGRIRVGQVTIAANTIFSDTSRADATDVATILAQSQLVCFYINDDYLLSCPVAGTKAGPANVVTGQRGNPVFVPRGFLQSDVSTAAANAQAVTLAESLLDCYWTNIIKCKECLPAPVVDPDNPSSTILVVAEAPGPVCVAAGTVVSYISQLDADEQAQDLANAQLICSYCNPERPPKCPGDSWDGTIPVPPGQVNNTWPITATRGIAGGVFCSIDPQDVVGIAASIANVSADTGISTDCCYGNFEVYAECLPDGAGQPVDSVLSSDPVVIAANTLIVCDSDAQSAGWSGTTQEYATNLAQKLADAALVCMWSNRPVNEACPAGETLGPASVSIPAGVYVSFRSQLEAQTIAETVARAQLNCLYCNPGGERGNGQPCPVGTTYLGQPTMRKCAFISSVSSANAAQLANLMSDSMAVCVDENDFVGLVGQPGPPGINGTNGTNGRNGTNGAAGAPGPPGAAGAQTSCDGQCYGYYS